MSSIFEKLQDIPRGLIFGLVIIAMAYPILNPIGLPITVGQTSKDAFNAVDETEDGSFVVFHVQYGAGGKPTLQPAAIAVSHHLFQKDVKVIYFVDNPVDLANTYEIFDKLDPAKYGKVYGEDYVVLSLTGPFLTQAAIVLGNLIETVPKDSEENNLVDLPMFEGYTETEDIGLVFQLTTSGDVSEGWVYQAVSRYNIRLVGGWLSMMTSSMIPYYQAEQILGFIDGSKGAADYEVLAQHPGDAVMITDILSLTQLIYLALIVVGNIGYFGAKSLGEGKN